MFDSISRAYLPETTFPVRTVDHDKCEKCGRCIQACPTAGFVADAQGYPQPIGYGGMDQACLNCWNCVAVCPTAALSLDGVYKVPKGRYKTTPTGTMSYPDPLSERGARPWDAFSGELTETERVIYTRRSNRLFKKKPVPRDVLHRITEAGRFAPSAGNCQPFKFIVITNTEIITEWERLAMKALRTMKNLYFDKAGKRRIWKNALFSTASLFMVNSVDPRPFTAIEKADQEDDIIYWKAPAVILICKHPHGISNPDLDCGICAQNMCLAAHALGLGTCYIGLAVEPMHYPHMKAFKKKIGVTPPWEPITSLAVGYPKGRIDAVVKRDTPPIEWID